MEKVYYDGKLIVEKESGSPAIVTGSGFNKGIEAALDETSEIEFDFELEDNPLSDHDSDVICEILQGEL